jgi:hypothetical protein
VALRFNDGKARFDRKVKARHGIIGRAINGGAARPGDVLESGEMPHMLTIATPNNDPSAGRPVWVPAPDKEMP